MARSPFVWRWGLNFDRTFRHMMDARGRRPDRKLLELLRRDGIASCRADDALDERGMHLLEEATSEVRGLLDGNEAAAGKSKSNPGKDYLTSILGTEFELDSPFVKLAIHPFFLDIANGYLGLRSCLRAINVWINRPTSSPAKESQLWHRDADDRLILKVFIYLADVDFDNGPFWFIPGTHGIRSWTAAVGEPARRDDEEMRASIADSRWRAYTGPARTTIFADTTGFHKGGKCEKHSRVLLTFQYVSAASSYPREFELRCGADMRDLDPLQRYALTVPGR
jgi:hypothetical protein